MAKIDASLSKRNDIKNKKKDKKELFMLFYN